MKSALIDPNTIVYTGEWVPDPTKPNKYIWNPIPIANSQRVCEVVPQGSEFPIAPPLNWQACADDVVADQWYYNDGFFPVPPMPPYPSEGTVGVQQL